MSKQSVLSGEAALGAAVFLTYLRDCFTISGNETWTREKLLVLLETMTRDREMFGDDIAEKVWNAE